MIVFTVNVPYGQITKVLDPITGELAFEFNEKNFPKAEKGFKGNIIEFGTSMVEEQFEELEMDHPEIAGAYKQFLIAKDLYDDEEGLWYYGGVTADEQCNMVDADSSWYDFLKTYTDEKYPMYAVRLIFPEGPGDSGAVMYYVNHYDGEVNFRQQFAKIF